MKLLIIILSLNFNFSFENINNISEDRLEKLKNDTTYYPFEENGLWGYENALCEELIKPQYQNAGFFNEGLAPVRIKDRYYFINKSNKIIIENSYDFAEIFINGKARVFDNGKIFFINNDGKKISDFTFTNFEHLYKKYIDDYIEPIYKYYENIRYSLSFKFAYEKKNE